MKRILALLFALLFAAPALAAETRLAHPALWHVRGKNGDVWLLGSIHILPPDIAWHTPPIDKAIARADVFVFEVSNDAASMGRMQQLITAQGYLPVGESLRAKLAPAEQADFDAALAGAGLPVAAVDRDRPWLASLQIMFVQLTKAKYSPDSGVDVQVQHAADAAHKEKRYFETIDQQFALLAPEDKGLELNEFKSDLKDLAKSADEEIGPLVDAWAKGDTAAINQLMNSDLDDFPDAREALLDDRNARWLLQIETMLTEKRSFFVTVGAGHLAGPMGVPALLRKAGYKVEGPG